MKISPCSLAGLNSVNINDEKNILKILNKVTGGKVKLENNIDDAINIVNNYMKEFIKYGEEKDYNSLEGCSEIIVKFAKKMFEKFPSVNGEHL